jgi:hypothetical protein
MDFNPQITQLSQPRLAAIGTALHDAANDPRVIAADNARQILNAWGVEPNAHATANDLDIFLRDGAAIAEAEAEADPRTTRILMTSRNRGAGIVTVWVAGQVVLRNAPHDHVYTPGPWESELAGIVRQIEAKAALRAEVARRTEDGHLVLKAA